MLSAHSHEGEEWNPQPSRLDSGFVHGMGGSLMSDGVLEGEIGELSVSLGNLSVESVAEKDAIVLDSTGGLEVVGHQLESGSQSLGDIPHGEFARGKVREDETIEAVHWQPSSSGRGRSGSATDMFHDKKVLDSLILLDPDEPKGRDANGAPDADADADETFNDGDLGMRRPNLGLQ